MKTSAIVGIIKEEERWQSIIYEICENQHIAYMLISQSLLVHVLQLRDQNKLKEHQ